MRRVERLSHPRVLPGRSLFFVQLAIQRDGGRVEARRLCQIVYRLLCLALLLKQQATRVEQGGENAGIVFRAMQPLVEFLP